MLAILGPAGSFLCAECLDCPAGMVMAPASCHEEAAPVVVADCCASLATAGKSAPVPAASPVAVPALAAVDSVRPAVPATAVVAVRPVVSTPSRGVPLFTLHSALLI
jgi:hypothetical protein